MSAARIGKIRMKGGGAEVRVLHQATPNNGGEENWAGKLLAGARGAAEHVPASGRITGYIVLAFYEDDSTFVSYRWGNESPMNRAVLPAYVAEIVRRDIITEPEAIIAINRSNGFEA